MNESLKRELFDYIYPIARDAESALGTDQFDDRYTSLTEAFQEVAKVMNMANATARKHVKANR